MDDIEKTRKKLLRLVHSADPEPKTPESSVRWSPFELCEDSLELLDRLVAFSKEIAHALEQKGESSLDSDVQEFVSQNVKSAKAVLFQLLKLSYQIRTQPDDAQQLIVEYAVCLQILEEALQELKLDTEAGYESAASALLEVQSLVAEQINRPGCDLDLVFDIINTLNDVKIQLNDTVKNAMLSLGESEAIDEYQVDLPSLDKMIHTLLDEGKNIYEVYEIVVSPSRAMPSEGRREFIDSLAEVPGEVGISMMLLTCLDQDEQVRKRAIELLSKCKIKDFDSFSFRQLMCLAHWSRDEEERESLQKLVRKLSMAGIEPAKDQLLPSSSSMISTAFDGSGCQVIFAAVPNDDDSKTFGIMLKQGGGIEDAWLSENLSQTELNNALEHAQLMPEQYEIDAKYLSSVLPHFLERTLTASIQIPHGLLSLVNVLPLDVFIPSSSQYQGALDEMKSLYINDHRDSADLKKGFLRLYKRNYFQMWFEEGSEVEKIVACEEGLDEEGVSQQVRSKVVEPNLEKWIEKFRLMSLLLFQCKKNCGRKWHDFYHVVHELENSITVSTDLVLDAISDCSRDQMLERLMKH